MYDFAALYQKKSTRTLEVRIFSASDRRFIFLRSSLSICVRWSRKYVDLRWLNWISGRCGLWGWGGVDGEDGELCFFINLIFSFFIGGSFKYVRRSICFYIDGTISKSICCHIDHRY